FRLVLEPAGLRQPTFRVDEEKLLACRAGQLRILESVGEATPASEIFAASTWFHELLARLSGNRFILQAIEQQSRLRRLVDYRSYDTPDRVKGFYREHIAMIDLVLARRLEEAAVLMEKHISDVVQFKPAALGGKGEDE
ncbi:FCD domain-containing protein, partial [Rhizobiaceae sp. 2RAB30]